MTSTELSALLVLATVSSFTPGPNTTLSTAMAANHGLSRAMRFVCAVPVGWGILFTLCATGLGSLVVAWPPLHWGIVVLGNGYLLWLASRLWQSGSLQQADSAKLQVGFAQGVGLQFLNIKAWMLALAIVAGWVAGREDATARTMVLLPIMVAYGFLSNLTYAVAGSLLRHWLTHGKRLLVFNRCMSAALVATVAWLLKSLQTQVA
ncbi:LysE family translocator [uncultured Limnohabitans sp.]|jgi:threonine/homoserine/homoserine lactone efflux protein|uniref:LysE family translocator n=1 Tax=uncultured Limnohabitans sp. TaxID=768543 RepID=UPI0026091A2F|nr:LysE family translocator [uncultured Limnohabitans sp.]